MDGNCHKKENTIMKNTLKLLRSTLMVSAAALLLTACGAQLIKPQDKHVEAMVQFNMPDYDNTTANVKTKIEKWMHANRDRDGAQVTYLSTDNMNVNGKGVVTFPVRGEDLSVKFEIRVEIVSEKLVKFDTEKFEDLPGPRQGESDRAYVFHNQVKDHIFEMAEDLEDYMNEDTKVEAFIDQEV